MDNEVVIYRAKSLLKHYIQTAILSVVLIVLFVVFFFWMNDMPKSSNNWSFVVGNVEMPLLSFGLSVLLFICLVILFIRSISAIILGNSTSFTITSKRIYGIQKTHFEIPISDIQHAVAGKRKIRIYCTDQQCHVFKYLAKPQKIVDFIHISKTQQHLFKHL